MSTPVAMIVLLLLLLVAVAVVAAPPAAAASAGASRVRRSSPPPSSFTPFRPVQARRGGRQPAVFFRGRAAGGCMPRGFHRVPPSAPSRYVNYHILDAGVCGGHGRSRKP